MNNMETDTWAEMCGRARYTATDARLVPIFDWAAAQLDQLTKRFCGLSVPKDANELAVRKQQERGMITLRTALLLANEWAKLTTPVGVVAIAQECQRIAGLSFPTCDVEYQKIDAEIKKAHNTVHQF